MRTFAQKPKATQPAKSTKPARALFEPSREASSAIDLQHTSGDQDVPQSVQTSTEKFQANSVSPASPHSAHDFSGVSVYPRTRPDIQPKLEINIPGDEYEQEADRVSEHVMRLPNPKSQRAYDGIRTMRWDELGSDQHIQTKRVYVDESREGIPPSVHQVLHSQGQPLTSTARDFMEPRFGHDFSNVRIHADRQAAESAKLIHARAFTVGRDVVFGAGEYALETAAGQQLLAHELVHVLQQETSGTESAVRSRSDGALIQRAEPETTRHESQEDELAADVEVLKAITAIEGGYSTLFEQIQIAQAEALAQSISWQNVFRVVGSAFAEAMKRHEEAVQQAEQQAEDRADIISAVVAVVAVGLVSYGSTIAQASMQLTARAETLINALEDAAQQAMEDTTGIVSKATLTGHLDSVTSEVPQSFQNYFLNEVGRAHQEILGRLTDLMKLISNQREITRDNLLADGSPSMIQLEADTLLETKTAVHSLLAEVRGTDLFSTPPEVKVDKLRDEIERGTWARWIPNHLQEVKIFTATRPPGTSGQHGVKEQQVRTHYHDLMDAIRERLVDLVPPAIFDLNLLQRHLTNMEVKRLIRWAIEYEPATLIPKPPKTSADEAE